MTNNLKDLKKELKSFAKRVKDFKYTDSALITFLLTGMIGIGGVSTNLFSKENEIEAQTKAINTSIFDLKKDFKRARQENDKLLRNTNLELIQLMEQGDHVTKSPWSSWQYGANGFYNNWHGRYKGRGDKSKKYPYNGIYERSADIYERSVSPDSGQYNLLSKNRKPNVALGSSEGFGIASFKRVKEPIIPFEVNASINPRKVEKGRIDVIPKSVIAPNIPKAVSFTPANPQINTPGVPNLPPAPTFKVIVAADCNNFDNSGHSCATGKKVITGTEGTDGYEFLQYTWQSGYEKQGLAFKWFDAVSDPNTGNSIYGNGSAFNASTSETIDGISVVGKSRTSGTTISTNSYNPQNLRSTLLSSTNTSPVNRNNQYFLVGGSRAIEVDYSVGGYTVINAGTVNLGGILTLGMVSQTSSNETSIINKGTITDVNEKNDAYIQDLPNHYDTDGNTVLRIYGPVNEIYDVKLSNEGYVGYKIGMAIVPENTTYDKTLLINRGTIDFKGGNSIGMYVFLPKIESGTDATFGGKFENKGIIILSGKESHGMKLAATAGQNAKYENSGKIILQKNGNDSASNSTGMALMEDSLVNGGVRFLSSVGVKNTSDGIININDNVENSVGMYINIQSKMTNEGNININSVASASSKGNIGMRADSNVSKVINATTGKINLGTTSKYSTGMVANQNSLGTNEGEISVKSNKGGVGMTAVDGGNIVNESTGKITVVGVANSGNVGMFIDGTKNQSATVGTGKNLGKIEVSGYDARGVIASEKGTHDESGKITLDATSGDRLYGAIATNGGIISLSSTKAATITVNGSTAGNAEGSAAVVAMGKKTGTSDVSKVNGSATNKTTITVDGTSSLGLFATDEGEIEAQNIDVTATNGAITTYASKGNGAGVVKYTGTGNNITAGNGGLAFMTDSTSSSANGRIEFASPTTAKILAGGSAFYYEGTPGASGYETYSPSSPTIGQAMDKSFRDSSGNNTLGNLTLDMDSADSTLIVASKIEMDLSNSAAGTGLYSAANPSLTPTITGSGSSTYKTFKLYRSKLNIDQDVNLDSNVDPYNRLSLVNSSVTIEAGKNVNGTQANQVFIAQEENLGNPSLVKIVNKGNINLTGANSTAIYAKGGQVENQNTGVITVGDKSTAIYADTNSAGTGTTVSNLGTINIGSTSTGIYSNNDSVASGGIYLENKGIIQSTGNDSVAMTFKPTGAVSGNAFQNNGKIIMSGDRNTALYATGAGSNYTATNNGEIIMGDTATQNNPNVALYTDNSNITLENSTTGKITVGNKSIGFYGYNVNNSGDITVGDAGIGIYSQGGDINLTGGTIKTGAKSGKDEAVGVYTVGSGQTITNNGTSFDYGDDSFGFVNVGTNNKIYSNIASTTLKNNNVYIYSNDTSGTVVNKTAITSGAGAKTNYGIYSAGTVTNDADIDLSSGVGSVAIYSIKGGTATNNANITVGESDITAVDSNGDPAPIYSIGMGAGYKTTDTGNIINKGTIAVNGKNSIGMYASGNGSTATNDGNIVLNASNTTGIYADHGATAINNGLITTGSGSYSNVVGVYLGKDTKLINNAGATIDINATNGVGVYLKGGTIANYGTMRVNGSRRDEDTIYEFTLPSTGKEVGGVNIDAPSGATSATITLNGVPQIPVVVNTLKKNPISVSASSIGLYVNTSGVDYTKSIDGLGNLTSEADLIIGAEAAESTNSKYILVNDPNIINPYRAAMLRNPNIKWNVYSGSIGWMATPTLDSNGVITSLYMAKIPYTEWAGREGTPVNSLDTYNFADGLEQRYGVKELGTRERQVFSKLNSIGNNEEILLQQAFDEMMGHQYANVQQRINATGNTLDKEFKYLHDEWRNPSKQNNKIKIFGQRDEYKTDTAGIIDYTSNAYGVAYVHEDEAVTLGNSSGWYAGAVTNRFKLKDIGHSREDQTMLKAGIFKTMSPAEDHNGSLRWTIAGDVFGGKNDMKRKFLVVDDIFQAKSDYYSYGAAFKTDLGYDIRMSERTHLRPYGALKMEYGRFTNIKEDSGEIRLEVDGNDYFSVKPEVGVEFKYVQPMAVRTNLSVGLTAAYTNELGKVNNVKNQARVRYTDADWFGIRGEKEDRRGSGKFDLNVGVDNTRFGVTANLGYDTKGENIRGGLGFRLIY